MTTDLQVSSGIAPDFFRSLFVDYFVGEANRRLSIKLDRLSRINVENEHNFESHLHSFYEVILPYRGSYKCNLNGIELIAGPETALLIQPGDWHDDLYLPDSELLFIQFYVTDMFEQPWTAGFINQSLPVSQRIINLSDGATIRDILKLVMQHERNTANQLVALGKLCEAVLWDFTALIPSESLSHEFTDILKHNEFVRQAEEYFHRHIFKKLKIRDFCLHLGMCRRAVEKKFLELFNDTPLNTFTKLKIKIAIGMLRSGKSIKETSDRLGYSDQFYFSTVFKRMTGYPPSKLPRQ